MTDQFGRRAGFAPAPTAGGTAEYPPATGALIDPLFGDALVTDPTLGATYVVDPMIEETL